MPNFVILSVQFFGLISISLNSLLLRWCTPHYECCLPVHNRTSRYTEHHPHPSNLAALDEQKLAAMSSSETPFRPVSSAVYGEFASPMSSTASLDMGVMGNTAAGEGYGMPRTGSHPRTRVRPRTGDLPYIPSSQSPFPEEPAFGRDRDAQPALIGPDKRVNHNTLVYQYRPCYLSIVQAHYHVQLHSVDQTQQEPVAHP